MGDSSLATDHMRFGRSFSSRSKKLDLKKQSETVWLSEYTCQFRKYSKPLGIHSSFALPAKT